MSKASKICGVMLCAPDGAPVMWADKKARCARFYDLLDSGAEKLASTNEESLARLSAAKWQIKACAITVEYDEAYGRFGLNGRRIRDPISVCFRSYG